LTTNIGHVVEKLLLLVVASVLVLLTCLQLHFGLLANKISLANKKHSYFGFGSIIFGSLFDRNVRCGQAGGT
jgi:hypothetical protein